jgi:L-alanine-DL-glutamate epimerase-like enolase superfamily enzyme
MFEERLEIDENGDLVVPDRPGLGFTLDRARVAPFRVAGTGL